MQASAATLLAEEQLFRVEKQPFRLSFRVAHESGRTSSFVAHNAPSTEDLVT